MTVDSSLKWACGAALLLFVAGRCLVPMDETDLFYNLRLGEIVLSTGSVPRNNLLSFTVPAHPDPNLAWLFQVVLALTHRAGGIAATVVLKTAFVLATFGLLFRVALRRGAAPATAAAVLALAAWAAEPRFVERPHLVTFLGIATLLLALERAEAHRPRLLWLMVPAGLLWANGNSCFFLAPALLVMYAAGAGVAGEGEAGSAAPPRQTARQSALVALLLSPLLFATPAGTGWFGYVVNHFRMPTLRPLQEYRTASWPTDGPFLFLLLGVTLVTVLPLRRREPGLARQLVPVLALALLGARRIRFVAEFALLAGPYVAARLGPALGSRVAQWRPATRTLSWLVVTALAVLAVLPRVRAATAVAPSGDTAATAPGGRWLDLGIEEGLVPEAAIRWLNQRGLRDRLYNDLEVGSYLTWEGWPRHLVFQDPRINAYPDELHAILRRRDLEPSAWESLMERFEVQAALITFPGVNPRAALFDPARWALCHHTDEALVFVRRNARHAALIATEELPVRFHFDPRIGVSARPLTSPPAPTTVPLCEWNRRLGEVHRARQDWPAAALAYQAALAGGADCLPPAARQGAREQAATLALRLGEPGRAADLLRGLTSTTARNNRGFALVQINQPDQALAEFELVLAAAPDDAQAQFGRALALTRLGRLAPAETALRTFLSRWPAHLAAPEARTLLRDVARTHDVSRARPPSSL